MPQATVQTVYQWIDQIAPFATAEGYDNAGLLLGSMRAPVARILVALDATPAVVEEAVRLDVQLIVTHHPLMFRGTKCILEDEYEGGILASLIRRRISLIAAHTNLDLSLEYSGTAALARALRLQNLRSDGVVFVGDLPSPLSAEALRAQIAECEKDAVYLFGREDKIISSLGICGGSFDEGFEQARRMGAQAYLTGEVRHHNALAAIGSDFVLYQGGHCGTEFLLVEPLAQALQNALNALKYNVIVYPSVCRPYGGQAV